MGDGRMLDAPRASVESSRENNKESASAQPLCHQLSACRIEAGLRIIFTVLSYFLFFPVLSCTFLSPPNGVKGCGRKKSYPNHHDSPRH